MAISLDSRPMSLDIHEQTEETDGHRLPRGGIRNQFSLNAGATVSPTARRVKREPNFCLKPSNYNVTL